MDINECIQVVEVKIKNKQFDILCSVVSIIQFSKRYNMQFNTILCSKV